MPIALEYEIASFILFDERNMRLVVDGYPTGTEPWRLADSLLMKRD